MVSPGTSLWGERPRPRPFTSVGLVEPRSATQKAPSCTKTRAWRRDTIALGTTTSADAADALACAGAHRPHPAGHVVDARVGDGVGEGAALPEEAGGLGRLPRARGEQARGRGARRARHRGEGAEAGLLVAEAVPGVGGGGGEVAAAAPQGAGEVGEGVDGEADPSELRTLESMVFPFIEKRIRAEIAHANEVTTAKFVILDAAILFETGWAKHCDKVVFVDSPRELRLARVAQSRGWDDAELMRRESRQLPLDEKKARSDAVIANTGDFVKLGKEVKDTLVRFQIIC